MSTSTAAGRFEPLQQQWPLPSRPRPIVVIGAGGVVNDAHLPAYRAAGLPVRGIFDVQQERCRQTAARFDIPHVYGSLSEAAAETNVVFDVAVPPDQLLSVLECLADGSSVLMQKPMGTSLTQAHAIADACRRKGLIAAVNFQLRFSPMMLAVNDLIQRGLLGALLDVDVHLNYREPWELFPFLKSQHRVEMLIVSIHYFDWIRSILGEPQGVFARSIGHPRFPEFATTRTSAILDYGEQTRCCLSLNNTWNFGPQRQRAEIRLEGVYGAAVIEIGSLLNYPAGAPDSLHYVTTGQEWRSVPLVGNWFPDAFSGTMSNLQRFADGEDACLSAKAEDALKTMALIEALYESNASGTTRIESAT